MKVSMPIAMAFVWSEYVNVSQFPFSKEKKKSIDFQRVFARTSGCTDGRTCGGADGQLRGRAVGRTGDCADWRLGGQAVGRTGGGTDGWLHVRAVGCTSNWRDGRFARTRGWIHGRIECFFHCFAGVWTARIG